MKIHNFISDSVMMAQNEANELKRRERIILKKVIPVACDTEASNDDGVKEKKEKKTSAKNSKAKKDVQI